MQLQGIKLNSFFLDAIDREAIKVKLTPTIKTAFLAMVLCQKLPRLFYKSNVNNISHCQACVLSWNFHGRKISKFFIRAIIKTVAPAPLSIYRKTHDTLIRKQRVSTQTVQI